MKRKRYRERVKEMQTKQDITKQRKDILPTIGGRWHEYEQSDTRETEQFRSKIWKPRGQQKAEWNINMAKKLEGLEESPKAEIHIDLLRTMLKNIKLENARSWWNI